MFSRRGAPHCGPGPLAQVPGALWRFSVCGSTGVRHPSFPSAPGTHTLAESPELVAFPAKLCSCCFPNHPGVPSFYGSACVSHGDTYSLHPRVHPPPPSGLVSASPVKLLASAVGPPHPHPRRSPEQLRSLNPASTARKTFSFTFCSSLGAHCAFFHLANRKLHHDIKYAFFSLKYAFLKNCNQCPLP